MDQTLNSFLKSNVVSASVPCRIDLGGTLDISTFYFPLRQLRPCTFNAAIKLRTTVRIRSNNSSNIKISSAGFEDAEFPHDELPFRHPLGLMFAIAAYFNAEGIHIQIESESPPRTGLGGSSSAAVALVAAFSKAQELSGCGKLLSQNNIVKLAYSLESSVAGVPCGIQDHLAAAFGGVNAWYWPGDIERNLFTKKVAVRKKQFKQFEKHILLGYCGFPHESKKINSTWVEQFLNGRFRSSWTEIVKCTHDFIDALKVWNIEDAVRAMNQETDIRMLMTPNVVYDIGYMLVNSAKANHCGARFTGAGGGGCIWAFGRPDHIQGLKSKWRAILSGREGAMFMNAEIDSEGLAYYIDDELPEISEPEIEST